jgi:ribosome-associated toxin RatA of RatAB toxin-antitoxin module
MHSVTRWVLVLTVFLFVFGLAAASAGPVSDKLSAADMAKLKSGDVVTKNNIAKDGSSGSSSAWIIIKGGPEDFWKTIWDYGHYQDFYPRLKKVTVRSIDQSNSDVEFQMDVTIKTLTYTLDAKISDDRLRLDWRLNENQPHQYFKKNNGYWILEPLGDGTILAEYKVELLLDLGILTSVATKIVNLMAKDDLPDMMIATKKRIESGNTWKRPKK